jgi:hypothetical protein
VFLGGWVFEGRVLFHGGRGGLLRGQSLRLRSRIFVAAFTYLNKEV